MQKLDLTKLFGFDTVAGELESNVNFQHDAVEAKLGAKVGVESWAACDTQDAVDFQNETLGAKLGAKVGDPEAST